MGIGSEKVRTMKQSFEINPFIERMLDAAGYDSGRVHRAANSTYVEAKLDDSKSKAERTDVKIKEAPKNGKKPATFGFSEKETTVDNYVGRANGPSRFMAWHDAQAKVWKTCGEPSDEVTTAIMPIHVCTWLATFRKTPEITASESLAQAHRNAGNLHAAGAAEANGQRSVTPEPAGQTV